SMNSGWWAAVFIIGYTVAFYLSTGGVGGGHLSPGGEGWCVRYGWMYLHGYDSRNGIFPLRG
ncbi:hypothetical protein NDU88_006023, partial [Pleurodeles waltl]